ncbi:MAG: hypothetical protein WB661_07785 [Candidatus Bathyarchaeia archaeon]
MKGVKELKEAVKAKSLTTLTKALSQFAEALGYQLKPPFTQIIEFKAKEQTAGFALRFEAELGLHYCNLTNQQEGLVFVIRFGGSALSDSPSPPIHELFYAGVVRSFHVYGYGGAWKGNAIAAHHEFMRELEVSSKLLNEIDVDSFFRQLERR